jgi:hypothetical protein
MTQLDEYPLGLLTCPDECTDPLGFRYWNGNDRMILGYMQLQMFSAEVQFILPCVTAVEAYHALRLRHEKCSGLTQIQLIQKLMQVSLENNRDTFETLMTTWCNLIFRIENIGHVDIHRLGVLFLFLNLKNELPNVHDALAPALMDDTLTVNLLESHVRQHFEMCDTHCGTHFLPPSTLTMPVQTPQRIVLCPNCKRTGHMIEHCVAPRGRMEGHTMYEAITHQCADCEASRLRTREGSAPPSYAPPKTTNEVYVGGVRYLPAPDSGTTAAIAKSSELHQTSADAEWPPNNSVDTFLDTDAMLIASVDQPMTALIKVPTELPFFLDSGASNHITCLHSDFSSFSQLREPQKISGVGNASVFAVGVGTVDLFLPGSSTRLQLLHTLYVPEASVRLVSIHQLTQLGYTATFHTDHCHLSKNDDLVAICTPGASNLYALPAPVIMPDNSPSLDDAVALTSIKATPNLETWHRRLGHANHRTVLDMAQNGTATGMTVDLLLAPQACDHCVLGKQACTPVPKEREGVRSTVWLERVHVDLSGPHAVMSRSGFRYVMNFVDDYSGYCWTRLLKSKSDAFPAFQAWLLAIQTQTGSSLCYLVTDNGELRSADMATWCTERGITHQFTAPHMSAQNGRVEHLHCTLMDKAHAMRLACGAPLNMWDEFILTASYLTTMTASHALNGRTPFELWFGNKPSLTHLREIGCRCFLLISGNNPKIAARSVEYVLIGYATSAKAYRCWDRHSGRIMDLHHVHFVEHLDTSPRPLCPGVILNAPEDLAEPPIPELICPPPPLPTASATVSATVTPTLC